MTEVIEFDYTDFPGLADMLVDKEPGDMCKMELSLETIENSESRFKATIKEISVDYEETDDDLGEPDATSLGVMVYASRDEDLEETED